MSNLALSATKQALLERLLREKGIDSTGTERITRSQQTGPAPLSFGQQRLWFLQQLDPGTHLYNIPLALRMEGRLNVQALQKSIDHVIRRHESLRTVFRMEHGQPVQVINPPFHLELASVCVQDGGSGDCKAEIAMHAVQEASHVFDLLNGPLLRAKLLQLSDVEHVLLICMHHIISDGWSIAILVRELSTLYNGYCAGRDLQLAELPIQYQDYARWQQDETQQQEFNSQLSYWKRQLEAIPPVLQLPADYVRPETSTFRGAAVPFRIPIDVTDALCKIARDQGATLFMAVAAAFSILLFRYCGQDDFALGTPVAGRSRPELEHLIGFFINTLVLRSRVSSGDGYRNLLQATKQVSLEAYAHQDLPFEKLVEELHPDRNLKHSPFFQVMLDLQNAPATLATFNGLRTDLLPVATETAKFDLTLTLYQTDGAHEAAMEYSTELFADSTVRRMTQNFQTLLAGIVASPDTSVSLLPLLSKAEMETVLVEWNGARRDNEFIPIHRLSERQAERNPQQVAVVCNGDSLTYHELNQRANQLAHYLQASSIGPEMLVGICLERSTAMIVAVLAVLKAGAAYVPLDPSYPEQRLALMIKDSRPALLLTEDRLLQQVPSSGVRTVRLDYEAAEIAACAPQNLDVDPFSDQPAYVIFTSGSTGRPKGVVISHGNLAHSVQARLAYYDEVVKAFLLLPSFSFDSSVAGLFWTLCQGGTLVIPRDGSHHDLLDVAALIEQHAVSHVLCLPGFYHLLLEGERRRLSSLRTAIVAGEACPPGVVRHHQELLPHARLFNEYGPTEASVWSTVFDCAHGITGNSVPIGRPIANTQIFILDRNLQPAPIGAAGELYIAGSGLGRGYLNNPVVTADRFIPNPFGEAPGSRLYKTGDLARYSFTGDIEFIGRNDSQVKIRGHRIELGEVEAALSQHPAIRESAVVASERGLIAYVVLRMPGGATGKELHMHLGSKLPQWMVPSAFVFLDSFPLTSSGKIDRKALPLRVPDPPDCGSEYIAPQTALEQVLCGIFAAVLDRKRIGLKDNFFDSGGHSLLATQLISRIREALQMELPLRSIFEQPTVAKLAAAILQRSEGKRVARTAELLVALSGVSDEDAAAAMEKEAGRTSREVAS